MSNLPGILSLIRNYHNPIAASADSTILLTCVVPENLKESVNRSKEVKTIPYNKVARIHVKETGTGQGGLDTHGCRGNRNGFSPSHNSFVLIVPFLPFTKNNRSDLTKNFNLSSFISSLLSFPFNGNRPSYFGVSTEIIPTTVFYLFHLGSG